MVPADAAPGRKCRCGVCQHTFRVPARRKTQHPTLTGAIDLSGLPPELRRSLDRVEIPESPVRPAEAPTEPDLPMPVTPEEAERIAFDLGRSGRPRTRTGVGFFDARDLPVDDSGDD